MTTSYLMQKCPCLYTLHTQKKVQGLLHIPHSGLYLQCSLGNVPANTRSKCHSNHNCSSSESPVEAPLRRSRLKMGVKGVISWEVVFLWAPQNFTKMLRFFGERMQEGRVFQTLHKLVLKPLRELRSASFLSEKVKISAFPIQ